jgi:molybdate/tungstate transport system substrate-binding protein
MEHTRVGRRRFLAGVGAAVGGVASAGCVGSVGVSSVGRGGGETEPVSMLVAGSLNDAVENGLAPTLGTSLEAEAHGSVRVARLVAEGVKEPDVVSVADVALFDSPLHPSWYAEFATNAVVVAYDPDTPGGRRVAEAGRDQWYRPLLRDEVSLGRTDPALDPLGYRTLFTLELASDYYDTAVDLRKRVPRRDQLYPETQLVSQFETGSIDAAFVYRSMAVGRGYDYVDLPAAIDLSTAASADRYATATYELDGQVVRGGPISYASTVRRGRGSPAVFETFERHTTGAYLREFGFGVPDNYPRYTGDVPDALG